MPTTTISTEQDLMTFVNVFTVEPEHQQQLIDVLAQATEVMRTIDGFVSANLHKSRDGRRVVNYAQWASEEHYQRMLQDPRATPHMQQAAELGTFDPITCDVTYVGRA